MIYKFGMVSNEVIQDPDVSLLEKGLYAHLCTYANKDTKELTVSVNRIATECGTSVSTVKRHLKSLQDKGIIKRFSRGSTSKLTVLLK